MNAQMRDYQLAGLNWLISLYHNNINGILADEMGLGKTIQSISMIGYLLFVRKMKGPFLVIVPLSTLPNWLKEFARFLPSAKVYRGHVVGPKKMEIFAQLQNPTRTWNVVITSYEFITRYSTHFKKANFQYAVIDEGHRAKNENTQFAGVLRQIRIQSMLMLTGTPVHNNLHELWALLNLLMPKFFNDSANFDAWFKVEDCLDPLHEQTIRLKNLLKPLLLRRTKKDVTGDIPPKVHIDIYMPPTEEICRWTHKVLHHEVEVLDGRGEMQKMRIINRFPHLRKVIQHPFLIPGADNTEWVTDDIVRHSSKMIVLDKLLVRLRARGSKVLIFSQYVTVLNILMDYLDWRKYTYCKLDGSTVIDMRQKQMDEFNRPGSDKFIFMLSTRAGGLGINLPAADSVIFYDMDFNPQMDFQAEDRAHRIGQTRKVHVFRLLVKGSIDDLLYSYSERKRLLDKSVINTENYPSKELLLEAFEYQRTSLMANGLIDEGAVDEKLDELFRTIGELRKYSSLEGDTGVLNDCQILLPGVSCDLQLDTVLTAAQLAQKRKAEDTIIPLTSKRVRRTVNGELY
uniref:Helicase n=1 Tax=Anopheles epiroticus TaxID=199890 RepID=A0A182PM08_9DIPT